MKTKIDTQLKKEIIKWAAVVVLILSLCVVSYYVGNQRVKVRQGYEYIKSERLDSLENASIKSLNTIDSINGELQFMRDSLDQATFMSDEELDKIVKDSYDELHNQTPSYIDTLFIDEYNDAVGARRLYYNR